MIYFDNAATTALHQSVLDAMLPYFAQLPGNPGAQHAAGRRAAEAVRDARAAVARRLGCDARDVVFTASGSEADNQAIRTALAWGAGHGRAHVVTSAFEHPAVLRTLAALEARGACTVTRVAPTPAGIVEPGAVAEALRGHDGEVALVSVMTVNNEVGTVQPVRELAALAHGAGALFHTDAVQAAGHVPLDMAGTGIDLLSLSAHKFHGPKGVGVLACRPTAPDGNALACTPLVFGGGQERGRRAGTENVPGIVGLAAALDEACGNLEADAAYAAGLRDRLVAGLTAIPGTHLVGDRARRNPGTVNVCFEGVHREALIARLDEAGICASAGSACEAGAVSVSPVLRAMGVPERLAAGALRCSLNADNTAAEVDEAVAAVTRAVADLRAAADEFAGEGF